MTERRIGTDRRKDACALCDRYRAEETKREEENEKAHETMWKSIGNKVPRWVLISIGIPMIGGIFLFTGWTALNGFAVDKRVVKLEVQQEYVVNNLTKLMLSFNIEPTSMPIKGK
jgi:hypothetical protein